MKNEINAVLENMTATTPEPEGLHRRGRFYRTAASAASRKKPILRRIRPLSLAVTATRQSATARAPPVRNGRPPRSGAGTLTPWLTQTPGFTDPTHADWTFENDNGRNPQAGIARRYVEHWEDTPATISGRLFGGGVGTGPPCGLHSGRLMEQEIPVHMTNFALILNDLAASFENRNEYISRLRRYPLLILDDFGMERGTEYGLEQVFNVIDSRYRSRKPLIVTTNLTLSELQHPKDTAHSRIHDRVLEMCPPACCTGGNFLKKAAQEQAGAFERTDERVKGDIAYGR